MKTSSPYFNDMGPYLQLTCPCGGEYLHQRSTTIYERAEDELRTTVIAQRGKEVQATEFPSKDTCNPSERRQGLIIDFYCEDCSYGKYGKEMRLAVWQHKGCTYVGWADE
jgi:hypothetical protein